MPSWKTKPRFEKRTVRRVDSQHFGNRPDRFARQSHFKLDLGQNQDATSMSHSQPAGILFFADWHPGEARASGGGYRFLQRVSPWFLCGLLSVPLTRPEKDIRYYPLTVFAAGNSLFSKEPPDILRVVTETLGKVRDRMRLTGNETHQFFVFDFPVAVAIFSALESSCFQSGANVLGSALEKLSGFFKAEIHFASSWLLWRRSRWVLPIDSGFGIKDKGCERKSWKNIAFC